VRPCKGCGEEKPLSAFPPVKGRNGKEYRKHTCYTCRNANYTTPWREQNQEAYKALNRKSHLKIKYGLTVEEVDQLAQAQDYACAICGTTERELCIDHNHETGVVRGLLCGPCNTAIAVLGDDLDGVLRAANYMLKAEVELSFT
jgi:hypothetical protein